MMEMEHAFPFFQMEDSMGSAAAGDDFFSWDLRGIADLISPGYEQSSPLPSETALFWGAEHHGVPGSLGAAASPAAAEPGLGMLMQPWEGTPVLERRQRQEETVGCRPVPLPEQVSPPAQGGGVRRSAFVGYENRMRYGVYRMSGEENIHRRVIDCLRSIPAEKKVAESSRCFRHMMRERRRRERLSQSYADLHSMIVPRPKANKNAIVLSAASYVRDLKSARDAQQRRHQELRASLGEGGAAGAVRPEDATVKLRVGNPTSAVDSMIAALRQLKRMNVRARSIRSSADDMQLSAVIDVETKMAKEEVEKAVEGALVVAERNLRAGVRPPHALASRPNW